jgi:hypothetical protein
MKIITINYKDKKYIYYGRCMNIKMNILFEYKDDNDTLIIQFQYKDGAELEFCKQIVKILIFKYSNEEVNIECVTGNTNVLIIKVFKYSSYHTDFFEKFEDALIEARRKSVLGNK